MEHGKICHIATTDRSKDMVLTALRGARSGLTRAELVARTGLSRPTVNDVVSELHTSDLVTLTPGSRAPGVSGPAPRRVRLAPPAGLYLGVDFGHRHITMLISEASGAFIESSRTHEADLEVTSDRFDPLGHAAKMVARALPSPARSAHLRHVVMGIPAPITAEGIIDGSHYLPSLGGVLIGEQFGLQLARTLRLDAPPSVTVENDANLGVVGETVSGVAQGFDDVIYIKASTGIGCGLLHGNRLWHGAHHLAGELGHVTVPARAFDEIAAMKHTLLDGQPECRICRRVDCLQNLASCSAVVRIVRAGGHSGDVDYTAIDTFKEVVRYARGNIGDDRRCYHAIRAAGIMLGATVADMVRMLDPGAVVVGGYLASAGQMVEGPIKEALIEARLTRTEVLLVPEARITDSEVEGAVALALGSVVGEG